MSAPTRFGLETCLPVPVPVLVSVPVPMPVSVSVCVVSSPPPPLQSSPLNHASAGVSTEQVLEDVIAAAVELFPDTMVHVGGDEVQYACWHSNQVGICRREGWQALLSRRFG